MSVRVKICGLTSVADALAAVDAGVDAVGLMFCEASPRYLSVAAAAEIARCLPPFIAKVGVFVDPSEDAVRHAADECGLDALQFHGDESFAFCTRFRPLKVIKAFRIKDAGSLGQLPEYRTDAWLLDSYVRGKAGGTGEQFNWELALRAKALGGPIILAGGLTELNVANAVAVVRPYAVDVSSGVESAPGKKDVNRMRLFVRAAKGLE